MKIGESVSLGERLDAIIQRTVDSFAHTFSYSSSSRDRFSTEAYAMEFIEQVTSQKPEARDFWIGYFRSKANNGSAGNK